MVSLEACGFFAEISIFLKGHSTWLVVKAKLTER